MSGKQQAGDKADEYSAGKKEYSFRLFVTGATPNSVRAVRNLRALLEKYLSGRYALEIIDVYKRREVAEQEQILALPLLVKLLPRPERRFLGDMSDTTKLLEMLAING